MKILVLSEIKYLGIKTRKQQLISRFPKDWEILFLEPYKVGRENNFWPKRLDNIQIATAPFLKNFKGVLKSVFSSRLSKMLFFGLASVWIRLLLRSAKFARPDLVIISNLYALPYLRFQCPVVYDMNDDHLAFVGIPEWVKPYREVIYRQAHKIVICSESLIELVPKSYHGKVVYIGNGVDVNAFIRPTKSAALLSQELERAKSE